MLKEYDARPVYRMIVASLSAAIQNKDWEKVKKIKTDIERITNQ